MTCEGHPTEPSCLNLRRPATSNPRTTIGWRKGPKQELLYPLAQQSYSIPIYYNPPRQLILRSFCIAHNFIKYSVDEGARIRTKYSAGDPPWKPRTGLDQFPQDWNPASSHWQCPLPLLVPLQSSSQFLCLVIDQATYVCQEKRTQILITLLPYTLRLLHSRSMI